MRARVRLATSILLVGVCGFVTKLSGQVTTVASHEDVTDPAGVVVPDITVLSTGNGISVRLKSDASDQTQPGIQPSSFGVTAGDPQPGRATQRAAKIYF